MVKVTFTLDEQTVVRLRRAAARLARPQSQVVRDAIREYGDRIGRLSERERLSLLEIFDTVVPHIPHRSSRAVDREIAALRAARRRSGRRRAAGA